METVDSEKLFQGVVCSCLDIGRSVEDTIYKLLDLNDSSTHHNINCSNLELKNKYYQATIHLFDYNSLTDERKTMCEELFNNCYAIILYGNGQKITTNQLDDEVANFNSVGGEPRVLLYDGIDEDCEPHGKLLEWCIKNGYDFIDASDETARNQLVDSLSAYKWTHRLPNDRAGGGPQLNDELLKKLMDFDSLLGKLSAYRDRPDLRGDPDDKNIMEIAEILSGLLGDDVDNFLDNEEGSSEHKD